MGRLIMWNVVTLDGFFEGEKPWDLSFHERVWGPELEALSLEQLREADRIVFGEKTYKGMADYWPNAETTDQNVAPLMNRIAKVVCSASLKTAEWNNTAVLRDAVPDLKRLKDEGSGPMYVFGSATLSESLMKAGLFDEIRLCVAPMMLGKGRRLFTGGYSTRHLQLLEARPLANSAVILRYEVVDA